MKEFSLQSKTVPPVQSYPKSFSSFLSFLSNYLFFDDKNIVKSYFIDSVKSANVSADSDKVWFQTETSTEFPLTPRIYSSENWESFEAFNQGDIILAPETAAVQSPWGQPNGVTYNVIKYTGTGPNVTVPYTTPSVATAPPPSGFKYKVYVGYY